jgi:hypothetical protein
MYESVWCDRHQDRYRVGFSVSRSGWARLLGISQLNDRTPPPRGGRGWLQRLGMLARVYPIARDFVRYVLEQLGWPGATTRTHTTATKDNQLESRVERHELEIRRADRSGPQTIEATIVLVSKSVGRTDTDYGLLLSGDPQRDRSKSIVQLSHKWRVTHICHQTHNERWLRVRRVHCVHPGCESRHISRRSCRPRSQSH